MLDRSHPEHRCSRSRLGLTFFVPCGLPATVVCTSEDGTQWFACDQVAHHRYDAGKLARIEPIGDWFQRFGLS